MISWYSSKIPHHENPTPSKLFLILLFKIGSSFFWPSTWELYAQLLFFTTVSCTNLFFFYFNPKDGTQVQFKSTMLQKYLCSENGGGTILVANRPIASTWETFRVSFYFFLSHYKSCMCFVNSWFSFFTMMQLWRIDESSFNFRSFDKQFVGLENQGLGNTLVAVSNDPGNSENFQIMRNDEDPNQVRIRATNGLFLQVHFFFFFLICSTRLTMN